jgi:hypothetical protein
MITLRLPCAFVSLGTNGRTTGAAKRAPGIDWRPMGGVSTVTGT